MIGGRARGRRPVELAAGEPPDASSVELLGTGPRGRSGAEVGPHAGGRRPGGSRLAAVVLVGGLVSVVAFLWLLGRPGQPPPIERAVPATSTIPATAPPTTEPTFAVSTTVPVVVDAPVAGEPTGLALLVGGDGPLQSLDLDSGVLRRFGVMAHPILVTGGDLVIYQETAGIVGWVPLDDPGQQVLIWKRGRAALDQEPGRLWVLDPTNDEPHPAGADVGYGRWELFDTESSRLVFRTPGDLYDETETAFDRSPPLGGVFDVIRPGPWFSNRPDGVYRAVAAGYTPLTDGRVLTNDEEAALVGRCPADGPCDLSWVGVDSGRAIDRPLPGIRPRMATLVGGGAWLHSVGWEGTSELLELASGRTIASDWATVRPAVSPDGRWLAAWTGSEVMLFDLGAPGRPRRVATIDAFGSDGPDSLLFAPTTVERGPSGPAGS